MKNLLDTRTGTLQDILGNGKTYNIPSFQRDYSWEEEHWEDLWNDFLSTKETEQPHYMGTIVLQNTGKQDCFTVVDGQQRLTTMTIFAVAIIKVLQDLSNKEIERKKNEERIEEIKRTFIGKKTIATLYYESKLKLNRNNNLFFQDNILILREPVAYSKLKDSEKLLWNSFKYFYNKISSEFSNDGEKITDFLENIVAKKMIFIQIIVDNELDAYTVFETLNARGVELTTTDLLKNYLFSLWAKNNAESQIEFLEEKWNKIVHNIGFKEFPTFIRYYLNSMQKLVRKEQLFKVIKLKVKSEKDVSKILDELEKKQILYNAIKNPDDDFWNDHKDKRLIVKALNELKLFGVSQPIPILFSLYDNLPDLFADILWDIVNISFRYNIIAKKNPNEQEVIYNTISQKIFKKEILNKKNIHDELKKIYVEDSDFKQFFSTKELSTGGKNKKKVKYILTKIENQLNNTDNDWSDANFTIEHILPENYSCEWDNVFKNNASKFIYRIGNYTLLEDKLNRECSNKSYIEKKEIYKKSRYKLTNSYCVKDEWNISAIGQYQEKLADFASSIWKIQF